MYMFLLPAAVGSAESRREDAGMQWPHLHAGLLVREEAV